MNKTVVAELDINGKEIYHTAGFEKYFVSCVGIAAVCRKKERLKEVVADKEMTSAIEFIEKVNKGILSAEVSLHMKMTDETYRFTYVCYEIVALEDNTKRIVVTFGDIEDEKQSREQFAEIVNERDNLIQTISGGIAIYEITDKIRTLYVAEETAELAGYTKEELMEIIGENSLALCHPDDIKVTQQYLQTTATLSQSDIISYEYRIRNKNGNYQWVNVRAHFVQRGDAIILYTIMTDIDKIKKAEETALIQKKMMELAFERSNFRFWDYDIDTHRLFTSSLAAEQLGYSEYEENVPESLVERGFVHPDDKEAYLEFYHNVQQGKNQRLMFRAAYQDGSWGWMDIAYHVFFDEHGKPIHAIGVGGDLTKQKEKEKEYLEEVELFRDISIYAIQKVFLDVFLIDIPTNTTQIVLAKGNYMNMKKIPGYDKILEQKICKYAYDKEAVENKLSIEQLKKNLKQTKDCKLEYTFRIYDEKGEIRWYRYYISYFHENTERLLVMMKDVTGTMRHAEAKRMQLEEALLQAKNANAAKNQFLSNMSHDIRTPMNVITNMARMVQEEPENTEQVLDYMKKIGSMSAFLTSIINDILEVSKMENSKVPLKREAYSCLELQNAVCAMMEPLCKEKNITFYMDLVPEDDIIFTDKTKLNRIFFNLLGNAVKFTPEGGKISFLHRNMIRKNGYLEWDTLITDTGCGMSKEFQQKMYNPFEQENKAVTDNLSGMGLGLTIAKMNTEAFGGKLTVESEPGKGTSFCVHLKAEYMSGEEYQQHYAGKKVTMDFSGKHVLLVEDHHLNMEIAKRILEKRGLIVTSAFNGAEAVEIFEASPDAFFDVIIMDIRMPVMDGLEAAKRIRHSTKTADAKTVPIIAMSANAFKEDKEESKKAGMNHHIAKPMEPDILFNLLSELFSS